jgi:hypothetical protein
VRPFALVDGIRIPVGHGIRAIGNAEARGLGTVIALAPEWRAHNVVP